MVPKGRHSTSRQPSEARGPCGIIGRLRLAGLILADSTAVSVGRYSVGGFSGSDFQAADLRFRYSYLKARNPDWPSRIIRLSSNAAVYGVVVFKVKIV